MLDKDCDSQTWAIVLQAFWSFSFGHWLLFHSLSVQFLYLIIFRPDGFLFVKPLNSDLWIIQTWKRWSNVLSTQNRQLSKESGLYLSFVTSSSFQKHRIFFPFLYMNLQKIPNITEFGWRKSVFFFHQRGDSKEVFAKQCGITWALRIVKKLDMSRIDREGKSDRPRTYNRTWKYCP